MVRMASPLDKTRNERTIATKREKHKGHNEQHEREDGNAHDGKYGLARDWVHEDRQTRGDRGGGRFDGLTSCRASRQVAEIDLVEIEPKQEEKKRQKDKIEQKSNRGPRQEETKEDKTA